jgi:hypothetical protein
MCSGFSGLVHSWELHLQQLIISMCYELVVSMLWDHSEEAQATTSSNMLL